MTIFPSDFSYYEENKNKTKVDDFTKEKKLERINKLLYIKAFLL